MIAAIIQARMGASRLPGKVLLDISGHTMLHHIINRVRGSRLIEYIVVATTEKREDRVVIAEAERCGAEVAAGDAEDVLNRYYTAAELTRADIIVRVTADDPFKDPRVLDKVLEHFLAAGRLDYASNTNPPSYPEGLDIEVFSFQALEKAWREAGLPSEREHVTPYIWKNPDLFRISNVKSKRNLAQLRWTVDYPEDLRFAREVYKRLYHGKLFYMEDILDLLEREPWIQEINAGIERMAGYFKSLEKDSVAGVNPAPFKGGR